MGVDVDSAFTIFQLYFVSVLTVCVRVVFCFVLFYLYYSFYLSDSVVVFICIAFFGYYRVHIQHRYDAKDPKYRILYNHFNQPGPDRCLTMKVRIIEKMYHHANSSMLNTPYRTDRELCTAMPCGCNDKEWEICQVLDAAKST